MREKLIQYIDLLFAGTADTDDIKQEILQNTLDRYDDLIAQGKAPEAAYSLAISGVGDIHEVLQQNVTDFKPQQTPEIKNDTADQKKNRNIKLLRAAAIACFILCPIPVLILENTLGVCLLLAMVAAGVGLLIYTGKEERDAIPEKDLRSPLHKSLHGIAWGSGITLYLLFSILTGAWYISWLIFPIIACTCSLINACFDLNKVFVNAVIRIIIFVIIIAVLIACLIGGYLGVSILSFIDEDYSSIGGTLSSSGQVSAQQVKDITVEWVSGSITIIPDAVTDIQFSESGAVSEESQMVWRLSGDQLIIQFSKPQSGIHFFGTNNSVSKDLLITVPQDWFCDELDIDSVSARTNVTGLHAKDVDLVNISGQCSFTDCVIADFDAETVSGKVEYGGQVDSLDFNTVSANCTANISNQPKKIDLESVSGDLKLILPQDCGFSLELDSVSGDFSSNFATTSENHRYHNGNGACTITADTVSGDVTVNAAK